MVLQKGERWDEQKGKKGRTKSFYKISQIRQKNIRKFIQLP